MCLWMLAPCFTFGHAAIVLGIVYVWVNCMHICALGLFMLAYVPWCEYKCGCDWCGCVHATYVEMKYIMVHAMMLYVEMR